MWTNTATAVPRSYFVDKTKNVDRDSLFAAAQIAMNWAYGTRFNMAIEDIRAVQAPLEKESFALARQLYTSTSGHDGALQEHASKVLARYWDLVWDLMGKYSDGFVVTRDASKKPTSTAVGYPSWWLDAADFGEGVAGHPWEFADFKHRYAQARAQMLQIDSTRHYAVGPDGTSNIILTQQTKRL